MGLRKGAACVVMRSNTRGHVQAQFTERSAGVQHYYALHSTAHKLGMRREKGVPRQAAPVVAAVCFTKVPSEGFLPFCVATCALSLLESALYRVALPPALCYFGDGKESECARGHGEVIYITRPTHTRDGALRGGGLKPPRGAVPCRAPPPLTPRPRQCCARR